mmetsp:Transcript_20467/g.30426  ORF Transcript_20467/g.30426 Transcript_20467/m.30426 type:complete len:170 (-) Transcript_20467:26-535(-)
MHLWRVSNNSFERKKKSTISELVSFVYIDGYDRKKLAGILGLSDPHDWPQISILKPHEHQVFVETTLNASSVDDLRTFIHQVIVEQSIPAKSTLRGVWQHLVYYRGVLITFLQSHLYIISAIFVLIVGAIFVWIRSKIKKTKNEQSITKNEHSITKNEQQTTEKIEKID